MNFDNEDSAQRAIAYDPDEQKLALSGDLNINANDVLCAEGKPASTTVIGNRRFRHIISESIDDYNSAGSRKAKSAVVKKVHDIIRATGGRFLKLDSSQRGWVELTQQRSLEKVSHAIRDATSTNETMKKKKQKVHKTIAQVAAHVTSRFPSVHLEGKLDDDDNDELLAFRSEEGSHSLHMHMSMPTLPAAHGLTSNSAPLDDSSKSSEGRLQSVHEESPMPPLLGSSQVHTMEEPPMSIHQSSTKLLFPEDELHQEHHTRKPRHQLREEDQVLATHNFQQEIQHHEDDFLSYINEVLGPVHPADLDIDPLKKLPKNKKKDTE